ncbi:MAG: CBS domain-containing protein, partial [Rhodovibrio sp.]|nr:CBS domain-containing protein [Rhodovibrio sp.]
MATDTATPDAATPNNPKMRISDRPEFKSKPTPLTFRRDATVAEAVAAMSERNYGAVIVTDQDNKVEGVMTERDVMRKIVNAERDAKQTKLSDVMTTEVRTARADDDVLDWLRIMSNERFRRLPIVDDKGRLQAVFTQGDFVSYTWPEADEPGDRTRQGDRAAQLAHLPDRGRGDGLHVGHDRGAV